MTNVVEFPERQTPPDMRGPERGGCDVIIGGLLVPRMHMYDKGETIDMILDGRFSYEFPKEWAYLAADFAANAMAIGAGYSFLGAETKDRPFASKVWKIEFAE
jgi:hypothetical protein